MKQNKTDIRLVKIFAGSIAAVFAMLVLCIFTAAIPAQAAEVSVTEINYEESTITVHLQDEDTMLYISDSKQKKWEYVPITKDASGDVTFDISWIKATKDYVIAFKGDVSTNPVKVTIPKQNSSFKATYNIAEGTVSFTSAGNATIQWKKKNGMRWIDVASQDSFKNDIYTMIANGATILLRLAPVNGTGANPGSRPSKEVSLNIPKKSVAPTIKINDAYMTLTLVKGMEYRFTDKYGIPGDDMTWTYVDKDENKPLSEIAGKSVNGLEDTYIQFRTRATSSKQVSNTVTIMIPKREAVSQEETDSCVVEYRSSTTFAVKAGSASTTNPFEYCIINQDDVAAGITLSKYEEIKWREINSSADVIIDKKKDKVDNGSKVYIRRKAYKSLGDDEYRLASDVIREVTIQYPGDVTVASGAALKTIAGVCNTDNPKGYLTFVLYSPSNSNITALRFTDGTSTTALGTADFKSVVSQNNDPSASPDQKYIITTTIMSTAAIDKYAESYDANGTKKNSGLLTALYTIGASSEVSRSESLINLQIYGASKVNNPSGVAAMQETAAELAATNAAWSSYSASEDQEGYTSSIVRIFKSNRLYGSEGYTSFKDADQHIFKFKIDFGTATDIVSGSNTPITVTGIKYDGVSIPSGDGTNYKIDYCSKRDASNVRDIRYAVVTLYVNRIETILNITARDTDEKLSVILSNGEVIDTVTMNLKRCASLASGSSGRTIAIDEVPTEKTVTVTNGDSSETNTTPNKDYVISFDVLSGYEGLTVQDVTWAGSSILLEADSSKVYLSVGKMKDAAINGAYASSSSHAEPIKIIFNNGYSIDKGYILTLTHKIG